jgi:hypothetical protein
MRIGQYCEWPSMIVLVAQKLRGFGEGNDYDRNTAAVEFRLQGFHLTEVMLARQSG